MRGGTAGHGQADEADPGGAALEQGEEVADQLPDAGRKQCIQNTCMELKISIYGDENTFMETNTHLWRAEFGRLGRNKALSVKGAGSKGGTAGHGQADEADPGGVAFKEGQEVA